MKMNPKVAVSAAVVLALIVAALAYRFKPASEENKKGPGEQMVGLAPVQMEDVPVQLEVNGSVVALKTVEVRAQISNLMEKIHVREGQFVAQGQMLFSLDDRADRANVEKLRSALARDRALLADLERQYKRAQDLKTQNFLSQSAVDTAMAQRDAQTALVRSDEAALAAAQVTLDYDTIKAPISGRLGAINVFPGTLVQPSTTVLVTLTQVDPIAVQFNAPEGALPGLQNALRAQAGKTNVRARIPGAEGELRGNLYFVDNVVDAGTGTIKAKAQFANARQALWPGQFVPVRIELQTLRNAMTIPAAALITNLSGAIVYVAQADNTVQPKPVAVRYTFGDRMVVTGLNAGDSVVTEGKQNLRAGSRIRVAGKSAGADNTQAKASDKP